MDRSESFKFPRSFSFLCYQSSKPYSLSTGHLLSTDYLHVHNFLKNVLSRVACCFLVDKNLWYTATIFQRPSRHCSDSSLPCPATVLLLLTDLTMFPSSSFAWRTPQSVSVAFSPCPLPLSQGRGKFFHLLKANVHLLPQVLSGFISSFFSYNDLLLYILHVT